MEEIASDRMPTRMAGRFLLEYTDLSSVNQGTPVARSSTFSLTH